jgi:hypothetical protein
MNYELFFHYHFLQPYSSSIREITSTVIHPPAVPFELSR